MKKKTFSLTDGYSAKLEKHICVNSGRIEYLKAIVYSPRGSICGMLTGRLMVYCDIFDCDSCDGDVYAVGLVLDSTRADLPGFHRCGSRLENTALFYLSELYIHKEHQGRGVGFGLLKELFLWLEANFFIAAALWSSSPITDKGGPLARVPCAAKERLLNAYRKHFPCLFNWKTSQGTFQVLSIEDWAEKIYSERAAALAQSATVVRS